MLRPALEHALRLLAERGDGAPADVTSAAAVLPLRFARLVKIEHTLFALPFAYVGALLAVDGVPSAHDLLWITVAMVGARSLAMGLNRLIDARARRAQSAHGVARAAGRAADARRRCSLFCVASLAVFLVAVFQLDPSCAGSGRSRSSGFVVYPYLKRVHVALPSLARRGRRARADGRVGRDHGKLPLEAWELGGAVAFWVAGFDLFYSLFDVDVDRAQGLHSVATRFGVARRLLGRARCCTR